jgi:hypothetical protein
LNRTDPDHTVQEKRWIHVVICIPLVHFHLREVFNTQEQYNPRSFLSKSAVRNLSQVTVHILLFWRNFSVKCPENLHELWSDQDFTAFYTDTSWTSGWGSVLEQSHEVTRWSAGWWSSEEVLEMIDLKELKSCRHGLHEWECRSTTWTHVKIYQDNMTGLSCCPGRSWPCVHVKNKSFFRKRTVAVLLQILLQQNSDGSFSLKKRETLRNSRYSENQSEKTVPVRGLSGFQYWLTKKSSSQEWHDGIVELLEKKGVRILSFYDGL